MITAISRFLTDKSFFVRTFLVISLLVVMPVLLLGIVSGIQVRNIVIAHYIQSDRQAITRSLESLDALTNNLMDISKIVYNDTQLDRIMRQDINSHFFDVNYIVNTANRIKVSNSSIDSVYIYMDGPQKVVASEKGYGDRSEYIDARFFDWYEERNNNNIELVRSHPIQYLPFDKDVFQNVFSVFVRIPLDITSNFSGAAAIHVKQSTISDMIFGTGFLPGEHAVVINAENTVVFSSDESLLYANYANRLNESEHQSLEADRYILDKENGTPYLIAATPMSDSGLLYLSKRSMQAAFESIERINRTMMLTIIALATISLVIAYSITYRSVDPINDLFRYLNQRNSTREVKSGFRSAVKEMIHYNSQIEEQLRMALPIYRERFLYNLLTREVGPAMMEKELVWLGMSGVIHHPQFLLLVEIDDYDYLIETDAYHDTLSKFSLISQMEAQFRQVSTGIFHTEMSVRSFAFILSGGLDVEQIKACCCQMVEKIQQDVDISLTVVLCDEPTAITRLNAAYSRLRTYMKYKYSLKSKVYTCHEIDNLDEGHIFERPEKQMEILLQHVRHGDESNAIPILSDILADIAAMKSHLFMQHMIMNMADELNRLGKEICGAVPALTDMRRLLLAEAMNIESLSSVSQHFCDMIKYISSAVQERFRFCKDNDFVKIQRYIEQNYSRALSLDDVCEETGLNYTGVNQVLKLSTGKTFIHYLNWYRVETAIQLMKNGGLTVKEVAEMVGFGSSKYFIKVFKEITGETPGRYR